MGFFALTIITGLFVNSDKLAKIAGPIGAIPRYFQQRALRRMDTKSELERKIDEIADERIRRADERWSEQFEIMTEQVESLRAELAKTRADLNAEREERRRERTLDQEQHQQEIAALQREIQYRDEYLVLAARREANLQEWAASKNLTLPPPPLARFRDWLEDKLQSKNV